MNIIASLKNEIIACIESTFSVARNELGSLELTVNVDKRDQFGDLSCNVALILCKQLKKAPRQVAEEFAQALRNNPTHTSLLAKHLIRVEIAGPGFCNLFMHGNFWVEVGAHIAANPETFFANITKDEIKQRYLLEFVSANPTGPLHLGHGRGGIIGDVLKRVLCIRGHYVESEFYINDAGSQIKKLGASLEARCQQLVGMDAQIPEGGYMGDYLNDVARDFVDQYGPELSTHEPEEFERFARKHMLQIIKKTLTDYNIEFDRWFSEKSLYPDSIEKALGALKQNQFLYEKDGALWFKSTEFGDEKDRVIRKTDGNYTYIVADVAYHKNKFDRKFDVLIDILGHDHHGYVQRLKGTMTALGYPAENVHVILYQLVKIKENGATVKMSKRAGTFTELNDVITTVGTDVARFFYLNRKAEVHLDFDLATALKKTDENPVYYIHYAYVRTHSLLRKAVAEHGHTEYLGDNTTQTVANIQACVDSFTQAEYKLIKKITMLQSILTSIERSYQTHLLSFYTLELAQLFHHYYTNNKILGIDDKQATQARLCMVILVQKTLATCLDLLGLSKPEKM